MRRGLPVASSCGLRGDGRMPRAFAPRDVLYACVHAHYDDVDPIGAGVVDVSVVRYDPDFGDENGDVVWKNSANDAGHRYGPPLPDKNTTHSPPCGRVEN